MTIRYLKVPKEPLKYKKGGFKFLTPTGKVELYLTVIEQLGAYRDGHPDPIFDINPQTAIDLNIAPSDW